MSLSELISKRWGPSLVPGGRYVIYQGKLQPIAAGWKDMNRYLTALNNLEKMQWSFSLPAERDALFKQKLHTLTKDLPPNWSMIIGDTICVVILVFHAVLLYKYKSKL